MHRAHGISIVATGYRELFTKATGVLIVPIWLVAMGWVVAHDVLPGFLAEDPPHLHVSEWLRNEGRKTQYAITGEDGSRLGTIWARYIIDDDLLHRDELIWIESLPESLNRLLPFRRLRIDVTSSYSANGALDEITLRIQTKDGEIRLHGERFHADFSFELDGGRDIPKRVFKVPLTDGRIIAGGINPFAQLSDIEVGQKWRMQVINPITVVLPNLGRRFIVMLVEVTGREMLRTGGGLVDCLVVESGSSKAWVDEHGVVIAQETTLPLVGRIRVEREAFFDEDERVRIRKIPWTRIGGDNG